MRTHTLGAIWRENAFLLALLALTLACHCLLFVHTLAAEELRSVEYRNEFLLLLTLSAVCSVAGFVVKRAILYRIYVGLRFLLLAIAFRTPAAGSLLAPILLSLTLFVESLAWDEHRVAVPLVGAFFLGFTLDLLSSAARPSGARGVFYILFYLVAVGPVTAIAFYAIRWREALAVRMDDLARSEETVRSLMKANLDFQMYANNIESESTVKERNRITRELHDMIGYSLTNVIVMMKAGKVVARKNPRELDTLFEKVGSQAEEALDRTRQILHLLRDTQGSEYIGLQAVSRLVRNFGSATHIETEVSFGNLDMSMGRNLDTVIFHIVQEGLTNAFRHGKATKIRVVLWHTESEILITVHDNGRGIDSGAAVNDGIGFTGMRERLSVYGGSIEPRNVADGFELRAVIPYHVRAVEA
jgi:signal transduction histidine kinase